MSGNGGSGDPEMVDKYADSSAGDRASELRDAYAGNTGDKYGNTQDKYATGSRGSLRAPPPPSAASSGSGFFGSLFGGGQSSQPSSASSQPSGGGMVGSAGGFLKGLQSRLGGSNQPASGNGDQFSDRATEVRQGLNEGLTDSSGGAANSLGVGSSEGATAQDAVAAAASVGANLMKTGGVQSMLGMAGAGVSKEAQQALISSQTQSSVPDVVRLGRERSTYQQLLSNVGTCYIMSGAAMGSYGLFSGVLNAQSRRARIMVNAGINGFVRGGSRAANAAGIFAGVYTLVRHYGVIEAQLDKHVLAPVGLAGSDVGVSALAASISAGIYHAPRILRKPNARRLTSGFIAMAGAGSIVLALATAGPGMLGKYSPFAWD